MNPLNPDVVMVTNVYFPTLGGITTYVDVLSKELERRGHKVYILRIPDSITRREEGIPNRSVRRFVHEFMVFALTLMTLWRVLGLRLRGRKVVVHSHSASFCLGIGVMAKLFGARALHTFHSPIGKSTLRLRALLPFIDIVVCVSEEQRMEYYKKCGIPGDSPIVPGGIDCALFAPAKEETKAQVRQRVLGLLKIRETIGPIVLFISRVIKEKGAAVLLDAAKKVNEKHEAAMFILVGPLDQTLAQTHQMKSLQEQIKSSANVQVIGRLPYEQLSELYRISDIFVLPSLMAEGSPMVIVEAMASGLPAVATRVGGLESRVVDNVTGRLVRPGDVDELAEAIIALLKDPEKRKAMGRESREIAVKRYSQGAMVDEYEALYQQSFSH